MSAEMTTHPTSVLIRRRAPTELLVAAGLLVLGFGAATVAAMGRIGETDVPPAVRERLLVAYRDRTGRGER